MFRFCVIAAAAFTTFGQSSTLTLQTCTPSLAAQRFVYAGANSTLVDDNGACVTANSGVVTVAPCAGTISQLWNWHADNTVESLLVAGNCFNANEGSTSTNTTIILYACGELRAAQLARRVALAANDIFVRQADRTILGQESGLCLSSVYVPPPPPPPPGTCTTALDCSLNGECTASRCACYPPWTGSLSCEALAFAPTPLQRGFPTPGKNETTWGGSIALDPVGGLYHMFVAEMMNECPLNTWGQNSRCTHAVANTPEGPYTAVDVAVTNWCHNPAITVQDNGDGTYLWALFHIGDGTGGTTKNCTQAQTARGSRVMPPLVALSHAGDEAPAGATLHTAPSPAGPWTPVPGLPSCNNPAPFLAKNGTYFVVCNGFELYSATNVTAPWTHVTTISAAGGNPLPGNYEDPFFFIDARGNFHVIYHVYRTGGASAHNCTPGNDGAVVSGHYFSADGFKWYAAAVSPYGNVIDLADGSQQLLTTRERPKMLFNKAGDPTHLSNGVCPSPGNFNTPVSCPDVATGCVDCKYNDCAFGAPPCRARSFLALRAAQLLCATSPLSPSLASRPSQGTLQMSLLSSYLPSDTCRSLWSHKCLNLYCLRLNVDITGLTLSSPCRAAGYPCWKNDRWRRHPRDRCCCS